MRLSFLVLRIDLSLVGSQMSNDEKSEQWSVHDKAGYDEVFGSSISPRASHIRQRGKHQPNLLTMMSRVILRKMRR